MDRLQWEIKKSIGATCNMYVIVMMTVSMIGGFIFVLASYVGFFKPVDLKKVSAPEMHLIYQKHLGPYHKSVSTLERVESWAKQNQISCKRTFGVYLDDPDIVDQDRLRSEVGCVTDKMPENLPTEYLYKSVPAREVVQATFEGSPAIGPMKVYPEAKEWISENALKLSGPVLEIHKVISSQSMTTVYHFPVLPQKK